MNYDAWLSAPYDDADDDRAHEAFQRSEAYEEAFAEWAGDHWSDAPEAEFLHTSDYADAFEEWRAGG